MRAGRPWLVLQADGIEATQWNGPVLTLDQRPLRTLGPDLLADRTEPKALVPRLRASGPDRPLGEALQDQRLVAGIGNMWMSETLWAVRLSPWLAVGRATDAELVAALVWARSAMRAAVAGARGSAPGLPPRRPSVPSLWHADRVPGSGRRQPHRLLVPVLSAVSAGDGRPLTVGLTPCAAGTLGGMTALTVALPSRYHGAELIASGGMADVYAATDEMLERRVAIKILSQRFALDPDLRARFRREARIAARLSNEPNIVTIFDVADIQERPAIVMEYLPGGTIAERMRAGRVSTALALAWLAQAGRALDAAHAQGVVHRDVKPANLMLSGDGELRVADFGIARIAGDSSLTSVGTVLGTSGYMSPEQAVGGTATPASDRYALAVVAFELLTGRRPYVAESFASEAAAHATAPIPAATTVDGSLPAAIDAVFERGLAKAPEDRFRSCGELVASLTGVFSESAGTTVRLLPEDAPTAPAQPRPPRFIAPSGWAHPRTRDARRPRDCRRRIPDARRRGRADSSR